MKKEFYIFLQFVLILLLAGFGYFGLLLLQNKTTLLLWGEHQQFILYWMLAFTAISFVRLYTLYLFSIKKTGDFIEAEKADLFRKKGVSKTIQYCIIAVISALISFWTFVFRFSLTINISELWLDFRHIFFSWLIGFFILSLLRLAILYFVEKRIKYVNQE